MWFKHRAWIPIAWLFSLLNLGAVWFAAQPGEPWHATIHALLAVLSAVGASHLMARTAPAAIESVGGERLQQSMDVIALEVERISEGQRFVTKLLTERLSPPIGAREEAVAVPRKDVAAVRSRDEER
jgi:hypothetical protein